MAFGTIQNKNQTEPGYLAGQTDARPNAGEGVDDTKQSRQEIVQKANLILNSLLATMGSTYVATNAFSDYAIQLKALSFEAARIIVTGENVYNDLIFTTTRPEFFYQNIETFLFLNQAFPFNEKDDYAIRAFLLALIKAYFNGARKASIETALQLALDNQATFILFENYLDARLNPFPPLPAGQLPAIDFVPLQHTFRVEVTQINSVVDLQKLQQQIFFLVNLIKPAHTFLELRFVYTEPNDGGFSGYDCLVPGGTVVDGFEEIVPSAIRGNKICDQFNMKIFEYNYEDFRHDCAKNLNVPVTLEVADQVSSTKIKTRYGPLGDGAGNLVSDVSQVQVYVDAVEVEVIGVEPLKGLITLANPIPNGSVVTVSYSFLRKHFEYMQTNSMDYLINQFENFDDTLPTFTYSTVLWSPNDLSEGNLEEHIHCSYKYRGFDALNSSLLNNPLTLVFNKISQRDKLNDYWTFESTNYATEYAVTLNYPTLPFVGRQELSLVFPDETRNIFYLNDLNSLMNNLISNIIGGTINHKLMHNGNKVYTDEIDKVYASLEYTAECEGTQTDKLKPFCESALDFLFDYSGSDPDNYGGITPELSGEYLVTNTSGFGIGDWILYLPSTGNYPPPNGQNYTFHRMQIEDKVSETFIDPIEEVFGNVTDISWFEHDFKGNFYDYILTNIENELLNDPLQLLPPLPGFDVGEEFHMDMVFHGGPGQGENGPPAFADTFIKYHKFLMNHGDSLTNTNADCSIISVRPMHPGCDGTYISDYLRLFSLEEVPVTGIGDFETYGDHPENPIAPIFDDSFSWVTIDADFTVSGFFNQVDLLELDVNALDNVPGFNDSLTGMGITQRFQDGFFHGYVVFYPYFIANFAPIFDHWWSTSITLGGISTSGGLFTEFVPLPTDQLMSAGYEYAFPETVPLPTDEFTGSYAGSFADLGIAASDSWSGGAISGWFLDNNLTSTDLWESTSLVLNGSGNGITGASGTGFTEIMPPPSETNYDILLI